MKKFVYAVSSMLLCSFFLFSCDSENINTSTVEELDLNRYAGKWYEIARMPHSFERNMDDVTADYTLNEDNTVRVVNRGKRDGTFSQAEGIAKLKYKDAYPVAGEFRVSFFRPFYGDYRIIDLAPDYSHAVVTSGTMDYLWILSRTPHTYIPLFPLSYRYILQGPFLYNRAKNRLRRVNCRCNRNRFRPPTLLRQTQPYLYISIRR